MFTITALTVQGAGQSPCDTPPAAALVTPALGHTPFIE